MTSSWAVETATTWLHTTRIQYIYLHCRLPNSIAFCLCAWPTAVVSNAWTRPRTLTFWRFEFLYFTTPGWKSNHVPVSANQSSVAILGSIDGSASNTLHSARVRLGDISRTPSRHMLWRSSPVICPYMQSFGRSDLNSIQQTRLTHFHCFKFWYETLQTKVCQQLFSFLRR